MAISLDIFDNAGLTTPTTNVLASQAADGTSAAVDRVVYLGSVAAGKKFQAASAPGVDQVVLSLVDAAAGASMLPSAVRLALSAVELGYATPGAPLNVGLSVLSGVANAIPIYIRIDTPALAIGNYTNLTLSTNDLTESAV